MPRATSGPAARRRHKRLLNHAKGNRGGRSKLFRKARETVERGWKFAYRDRKVRKRNFRQLWIVRINAAARSPWVILQPFYGRSETGQYCSRS